LSFLELDLVALVEYQLWDVTTGCCIVLRQGTGLCHSCDSQSQASSPKGPGFVHRSVHVGFVVDTEAVGQVFFWVFQFFRHQYHSIVAPYSLMYYLGLDIGPNSKPIPHRYFHPITTITIISRELGSVRSSNILANLCHSARQFLKMETLRLYKLYSVLTQRLLVKTWLHLVAIITSNFIDLKHN
jgi:hypothetical protein